MAGLPEKNMRGGDGCGSQSRGRKAQINREEGEKNDVEIEAVG